MEPIYAKTQGSAGKRVAESNKDDQSLQNKDKHDVRLEIVD